MIKPFIIGITGGSASGKTTLASRIADHLNHNLSTIKQDNYYRDRSFLPKEERVDINYDHPDAFDTNTLITDLRKLKVGEKIESPLYDFQTHTRSDKTLLIEPFQIIVLDGILIFNNPEVREILDMKVYVDTDSDIRFIRRLQRDTTERARTPISIIHQYLTTVKPMHDKYIEPQKIHSDIIIQGNEEYSSEVISSIIENAR